MTRRPILLGFCLVATLTAFCQQPEKGKIFITVLNEKKLALENASIDLLRRQDSSLISTQLTDSTGSTLFDNLPPGEYICKVSTVNFNPWLTGTLRINRDEQVVKVPTIILQSNSTTLKEVKVVSRKPFVQQMTDKVVINVDAGITNAGATVMEVLEKSPGITIDKDGNISLKGRQGVSIMLDGKPTYLSGTDLVNLLTSMNANQLDQIEIMDNPPAKYDAAGNAGLINLKTKKNKQRGFNGNISTSFSQGRYAKTNNSIQLNYRNGKFNVYVNYGLTAFKGFADLYALRTYFKDDDKTVSSYLEQPTYIRFKGYNQTLRAGLDFYLSKKTTLGVTFTGLLLKRNTLSEGVAKWMDANYVQDSVINTTSTSDVHWKNGGINLNLRHSFNANEELSADFDLIGYNINSDQYFNNTLPVPGGYTEEFKGTIPSEIHILSGKADYSKSFGSNMKFETGWKSSHVATDNLANYYYKQDSVWEDDLGKSNHFLYTENIHALYGNFEKKWEKWSFQGGLRYEYTAYHANQLGNAIQKDSSFSRKYKSLFPTSFVSYKLDSINTFSLSIGRRIDRPPFQKLNPFVFILNKYTYEMGNPYYRPQFTWNFELSHSFKDILITSLSYSVTKDYFSQIFLADTSGHIIYTEGNLGRMRNLGLSVSLQISPAYWWSISGSVDVNNKKIEGTVVHDYVSSITQASMTLNNQFHFNKGWSAELTGFYITKSQNDLQEVLQPTGQVSAGLAKQVLKNKGSLKLTARDIFYTQAMEGLTQFQHATEYFKLTRDSRVITLAFSYRFGKLKPAARRSSGGAGDEIDRVGSGG